MIRQQHADAPHALWLLRPRQQRPRGWSAAQQRDELAPFHSITSSARASSVGGTSMPSAFAAFMLMISSNLVGCSTGRSAGFAPSNILSMVYSAARRGCPCPRCRHDVEIPNQPAARAGLSWGTNARNLDRRRVETAVELARQDRFLGGSESFFVAPCCGTLRRILYLLDGCSRGEPTRLVWGPDAVRAVAAVPTRLSPRPSCALGFQAARLRG
jgi:hypothetical protein